MRTTGVANQLNQAIERQIIQRTWGRIHRLQVEVVDERVIIRGQTSTHYAKQLALQAVLDVVGDQRPVDLDIQVGTGKPPVQPWQR